MRGVRNVSIEEGVECHLVNPWPDAPVRKIQAAGCGISVAGNGREVAGREGCWGLGGVGVWEGGRGVFSLTIWKIWESFGLRSLRFLSCLVVFGG